MELTQEHIEQLVLRQLAPSIPTKEELEEISTKVLRLLFSSSVTKTDLSAEASPQERAALGAYRLLWEEGWRCTSLKVPGGLYGHKPMTEKQLQAFAAIREELYRLGIPGEADFLNNPDYWPILVRLKCHVFQLDYLGRGPEWTKDPRRQTAYDLVVALLTDLGVPTDTQWTCESLEAAQKVMGLCSA